MINNRDRGRSSSVIQKLLAFIELRRRAAGDDSGQALVLAVIVILMIAILVPVVGGNIITETVQTDRATLAEDALAAAYAGMNEYRNYIDNNSQYFAYVCGTPNNNPALGAGAGAGYSCNSWAAVPGTVNEWFHYIPDSSQLSQTTGGSSGEMLLEVTGRAGTPGNWAYRTILAGYTLSGILTDSYYSDTELADPQEPGVYENATITIGGVTQTEPMNQISVEYAESISGGTFQYFGPETLLHALCVYHNYDENTFVDSLGLTNKWVGGGSSAASYANPYYGPFYDNPSGGISFTVPGTLPNGVVPPNAGATIKIAQQGGNGGMCGVFGQGIYNNSVTFNGIAYSTDELAFCGNPNFNASPPIVSGAPSAIPFRDKWPGSVSRVVGGVTEYFPAGYTYDFTGGCSSASQPNYGATASPKTPQLNGNQRLPPTAAGLLPYADGQLANGCVFTGPTMVQFIAGGTMNVWSPLTQNTEPDGSATACGTYTPGQPYQTGVTVPTGAVIYVEAEQSSGPNSSYSAAAPAIINTACGTYSSGSPPPANKVNINVCVPSGATYVSAGQVLQGAVAASGGVPAVPQTSCIDPYWTNTIQNNALVAGPSSLSTCEQGDAIVEGEMRGSVTLAADNNVIVSRDLTYQCADLTAGVASDLIPSAVGSACQSAGTNDVLALVPTQETIVAGPTNQPFNTACTNSGGSACGATKAPTCADNGTGAIQNISNVVPWTCDINTTFPDGSNGVVVDAAVVDLTGSTYAQNFEKIPLGSANMYQNGTNINFFPGFNGAPNTGYDQVITYDQRLAYENPPGLLQATDTVWNITSYVVCGAINTSTFTPTNPGTKNAAQSVNCPTLP